MATTSNMAVITGAGIYGHALRALAMVDRMALAALNMEETLQ